MRFGERTRTGEPLSGFGRRPIVLSPLQTVDILVVAGGGGGGNRSQGRGSPGGAGGLIYITSYPAVQTVNYAVSIAGAAALDTQGSNTTYSGNSRTLTALGGGHGRNYDNQGAAPAGGSSGGSWYQAMPQIPLLNRLQQMMVLLVTPTLVLVTLEELLGPVRRMAVVAVVRVVRVPTSMRQVVLSVVSENKFLLLEQRHITQAVAARPTGMAVLVIVMQEVLEGEAEEITVTTTLIDTAQQTLVVAVVQMVMAVQVW